MLCCAASFVGAAYVQVRLTPQDSRALPLALFLRSRSKSGSLIFSVTGDLKMSVKGSGSVKNSFAAAQNLFRLKYDKP